MIERLHGRTADGTAAGREIGVARGPTNTVRPVRGPEGPTTLLLMQATAGNAAVAAVLRGGTVQRDPDEPDKPAGGAKASAGSPVELIFIIRTPDDQFTKDMTDYVRTTLKGHAYVEVSNIEDICAHATRLQAKGVTLSKVRIVAHGQTQIGGVRMTPAGEEKWRYVTPEQVKAYAAKPECKSLKTAMAPGGDVEFWGCYLGGIPKAGEAWAGLFNAPVRSTIAEMRVGTDRFAIGKRTYTSSDQVPKLKNPQKSFRKWLLDRYKVLSATGEAPSIESKDEQFAYMKDLFDRSSGVIRSRVLTEPGAKAPHRPGGKKDMKLWKTVTPE